jgi:hypothetical protein
MMNRLNIATWLSLMLGGILIASMPMQATTIVTAQPTALTFTGNCTDCSGTGVGTLTVTGYSPGNPLVLSTSNFVSFTYVSNLLPTFAITAPTAFSGTIPAALPATFSLTLIGTGGEFITNSAAPSWCIGPGTTCTADHGTTFSIAVASNPTPEPGALSLMILGFGGLGLAGRRHRRRTQA